jgi:catechol 2,3-dioxygenase
MDAANLSALPTAASRAPLHVAAIALAVRDLGRLCDFYSHMLGLAVHDRGASFATLGVEGVPLLRLEHRPDAAPDDTREAGLYHTAFLMPTRGDLARWILHMARDRVAITGASDHGVSEAIYLDDPEGNGIEVYHDRPAQTWTWTGDEVRMVTEPLDIENIVREVEPGAAFAAAPEGLRIGHVHLRVGDVAQAERFYRDALGLEVTRRRHGATFMSTGRYHHHIAGNVWHSAGAGRRNPDRAGLAWVALEAADASILNATAARLRQAGAPVAAADGAIESIDPWGTRIRILTS